MIGLHVKKIADQVHNDGAFFNFTILQIERKKIFSTGFFALPRPPSYVFYLKIMMLATLEQADLLLNKI